MPKKINQLKKAAFQAALLFHGRRYSAQLSGGLCLVKRPTSIMYPLLIKNLYYKYFVIKSASTSLGATQFSDVLCLAFHRSQPMICHCPLIRRLYIQLSVIARLLYSPARARHKKNNLKIVTKDHLFRGRFAKRFRVVYCQLKLFIAAAAASIRYAYRDPVFSIDEKARFSFRS